MGVMMCSSASTGKFGFYQEPQGYLKITLTTQKELLCRKLDKVITRLPHMTPQDLQKFNMEAGADTTNLNSANLALKSHLMRQLTEL